MTVILAVSRPGVQIGDRLARASGWRHLVPARWADDGLAGEPVDGRIADIFAGAWRSGENIVFIGALGIAVRITVPLIGSKLTDPALVVVDDSGRWAIAALGGHQANGNALAREAARHLGALPVITTASDALDLPSIDHLGQDRGWTVTGSRDARLRTAAALVNGDPVALYQDAGEPYTHSAFRRFETLDAMRSCGLPAVAITDRLVIGDLVIVRPKSLAVGIGCRRGTSREAISEHLERTLHQNGLAVDSVALLATADIKADEVGLLELARDHGWPLLSYSTEQLVTVDAPTPSQNVQRLVGVPSVAEASAILAAGGNLIVPKTKAQAVTVAVARIRNA